jgi:dolichol kinase
MNENIKYYLIYAVAYGIILLLGEGIYRMLKGGPAWSRSFAHLSTGLITLPFPWLFTSHWWVLILSLQSCLVLWVTRKLKIFPSHHRIAGKSVGSYLFFASVYLCYVASMVSDRKELFVVPLLVLSFSDAAAALAGRSMGKRIIPGGKSRNISPKTLIGSTAFFITALPVFFFSFYSYLQWSLGGSIIITLLITSLSTIVEAYSPYGTDNISVPFTVLIIMYISFLF